MVRKKSPLIFPLLLLVLAACSLNPRSEGTSRLYLSIASQSQPALPQGLSQLVNPLSVPTPVPNDPDCYAVNVVGQGIPDDRGEDVYRLPEMLKGSSCAYAGVTSVPVLSGTRANVELVVPSGPKRIIQMLGIYEAPGGSLCSSKIPVGKSEDDESNIFEMGRVITDIFSDRAVEVPNTFPASGSPNYATERLKYQVNCGDGQGGGGGGGSVSQIGIFPANPSMAPRLTNQYVLGECVPLNIQTQNSFGGGAVPQSSVTISVTSTSGGTVNGNFYPDSASCAAGTGGINPYGVSIPNTYNTQTIYYRSDTVSAPPKSITASANGLNPGSLNVHVEPQLLTDAPPLSGSCKTYQILAVDQLGNTQSVSVAVSASFTVPNGAVVKLSSGNACMAGATQLAGGNTATASITLSNGIGYLSIETVSGGGSALLNLTGSGFVASDPANSANYLTL